MTSVTSRGHIRDVQNASLWVDIAQHSAQ